MTKNFFSLTNVNTIFFLAALISLPMLFQYVPANDCAARYAPMAEAFATGDFNMAFHSRFLPLYTILTGSVCFLFKCSGYFACKFVCYMLFSFSVYPIFYTVKFISNKKKLPLISAYLLIFCYPLIAFIGGGTRANLKSFLITCIAWAFIGSWKHGKLKYLLCCSVFAALLTLTRGDSALYAILVLGTLLIKEIFSNKVKYIYKPFLAGMLFLAILSPWLYFQYNNIGYPVPETRHGMLLNKMSEKFPAIKLLHNKNSKYDIVTGNIKPLHKKNHISSDSKISTIHIANAKISAVQSYHNTKNTIGQFFQKLAKGFFPAYLFFAIIGIIVRFRDKSWGKFDTILLSMFLGHNLLIILQVLITNGRLYVSMRYILPAVPLYFIWITTALLFIYKKFKNFREGKFKYVLFLVCLVAIVILLQQGYKKTLRENVTRRTWTKDLKEISKIINTQKLFHLSGEHTTIDCNFNLSPIIMTNEPAIGYYSKCKVTSLKCAQQNAEATNKLIADGVIHFIAIRLKYAKGFSALNNKLQAKEIYRGKRYTLWMTKF